MDSKNITVFLQEHWYIVSLLAGIVILLGAIRNWSWLCDPAGAPDSQYFGRGSRRVLFFLLGSVLLAVGIWALGLAL